MHPGPAQREQGRRTCRRPCSASRDWQHASELVATQIIGPRDRYLNAFRRPEHQRQPDRHLCSWRQIAGEPAEIHDRRCAQIPKRHLDRNSNPASNRPTGVADEQHRIRRPSRVSHHRRRLASGPIRLVLTLRQRHISDGCIRLALGLPKRQHADHQRENRQPDCHVLHDRHDIGGPLTPRERRTQQPSQIPPPRPASRAAWSLRTDTRGGAQHTSPLAADTRPTPPHDPRTGRAHGHYGRAGTPRRGERGRRKR